MNEDVVVPVVAIVSIFVLLPISIAYARVIWKRASAPPCPLASDQAVHHRLEQLQHAVDTIAVEVERISEGQRFVTKVLSERQAIGSGAAEHSPASGKAAVRSERG